MPATRSRSDRWRDYLQKIQERGGGLEISVRRPSDDPHAGHDVVWRVRLLAVDDEHILVEQPAAMGESLAIRPGVELVGCMTVGQNRWMFVTRSLAQRTVRLGGLVVQALALAAPERVERCSRRSFYRISTAGLELPEVQCWPLLDPASAAPAQAANREAIRASINGSAAGEDASTTLLLPTVGPRFAAHLVNISGGGLGLMLPVSDSGALDRSRYFWIRLDLRPHIPAPVALTAKLAHSHLDSGQNLYAGLAFDFSHDPAHQKFVAELCARYIDRLQVAQESGRRLAG